MKLTYDPGVFDRADLDAARRIILTPEGSTTEQRWNVETPYVADLIVDAIYPTQEMILLDYGCGIGRLAKEILLRRKCHIIGADISLNMRTLANDYVRSHQFFACSPLMLDQMVRSGLRVDAAISVWVLQHCADPSSDISRIQSALKPAAALFILNNIVRAVPTKELSWIDDQRDIKAALSEAFTLLREGRLPPDKIAPDLASLHFWGVFRNEHPCPRT